MDSSTSGGNATLDDEIPPIPEQALLFRRTINQVKRTILNALEKPGNQEADALDDAADRIQQLGNTLKEILRRTDPEEEVIEVGPDAEKILDDVQDLFEEKGMKFEIMDPDTRRYCAYYIYTDIETHPYDLSPEHINSTIKR